MADRLDRLLLFRSRRVGPVTFIRLAREHGNVAGALQALPDIAAAPGATNYRAVTRHGVEVELIAGHYVGANLPFL